MKIKWKKWSGQHESFGYTFDQGDYKGGVYDMDGDGVEVEIEHKIHGEWTFFLKAFYCGVARDDVRHGKATIEQALRFV